MSNSITVNNLNVSGDSTISSLNSDGTANISCSNVVNTNNSGLIIVNGQTTVTNSLNLSYPYSNIGLNLNEISVNTSGQLNLSNPGQINVQNPSSINIFSPFGPVLDPYTGINGGLITNLTQNRFLPSSYLYINEPDADLVNYVFGYQSVLMHYMFIQFGSAMTNTAPIVLNLSENGSSFINPYNLTTFYNGSNVDVIFNIPKGYFTNFPNSSSFQVGSPGSISFYYTFDSFFIIKTENVSIS